MLQDTGKYIRLSKVGLYPAVPAGELVVGDEVILNKVWGRIGTITEVTANTVEITLHYSPDDKMRFRKTTLVGVSRKEV